MNDLALSTTDELIDELKSRSRALVIGIEPLADQGSYKACRHGSKLIVAGLLRSLTLDSDYDLQNDPRDKPELNTEN